MPFQSDEHHIVGLWVRRQAERKGFSMHLAAQGSRVASEDCSFGSEGWRSALDWCANVTDAKALALGRQSSGAPLQIVCASSGAPIQFLTLCQELGASGRAAHETRVRELASLSWFSAAAPPSNITLFLWHEQRLRAPPASALFAICAYAAGFASRSHEIGDLARDLVGNLLAPRSQAPRTQAARRPEPMRDELDDWIHEAGLEHE